VQRIDGFDGFVDNKYSGLTDLTDLLITDVLRSLEKSENQITGSGSFFETLSHNRLNKINKYNGLTDLTDFFITLDVQLFDVILFYLALRQSQNEFPDM